MKPGLRKVAALILASATLFGSGASAVSAAYADDTTMGTSTRIQAEPDVKTTTGGEAAAKPDTGSGDEAGTGADEQSGTGAPAQSAPQADAGQAAPDVTIHDMLDTDSAAVSRLRLADRITGTAPFDKDNERGDDKDEANDIVRSYDTVTYDYEYTLTPDSTMDYYRRTRVGFRFELPYPKDKVTFDAEKMGWVDHTPGYEPKLTTETINGTVTQVYTCYRLLEPTSQSPTVNPGTGSIGLSVAVKGAPHGYRFHPTVKAWPAWDASNPTNTGTHKRAEDTPKDVTVSAKLNLNVRMVDYGNVDRGVFDFSSGAANAPNRTEGKVTGLGLGVALVTEMRWPDRTKGLKGLEAPSGRITYRLHLSNQYSDDTKTGTKHAMERRWQPLLYDYGHIDNMDSKYGRTFAWMDDLRYRAPGVADRADGYDRVARGNTTITTTTGEQGTDVTVSFDGYDTSVFPIHNKVNGPHKCSTDYMTSDCSTMQVGAIHTDVLQFITPTSRDGRTVAQYYGHVDQTANISMDDMGLTATGVSGDRLATAEDNSNQASTGDDHAGSALTVRMPGTYSTRIRYTCWNNEGSWNDAGTSCDWTQPDYGNGSDSLIQGSKLRLQIGHNIIINSEGDAEVMGMGLVKFDPNSIEPVDDHPDTQPTIFMNVFTWGARAAKRRNQIPYWYAVKKDGTGWKDYREQRDTKISGLDYYPTLNEAKRHGTIVGMLFEDHNTVDPTGTSFNRTFTPLVSLPARILDTARIGTVTPIVAETAYWTRKTLARTANLNVDASDTQWQQWSDNLTARLPEYANSVKPDLTYSGDTYRPATFDDNGVYQGGDTADTLKGDSLYIAGETPHIAKQVEQTNEAGNAKTVYDLDKEQRAVDWKLTATADTSTTTDGGQYTTDYIITDTLPKGLTYVDGSMTVGGQYSQHTPDKGTVTGGTPVTPTIVVNKNGTTTMTIRVNGARADSGTQTVIHYSTTIGDASDPDHDVRNNDSFTNHASIQSKRNMAPPLAPKAQIADATVRVSRTRASALATRADPLLNDINRPLGYRNMLGNFSKDEKTNPYAVDIMPYNKGLNQSNYHGDYALTGLTVKAGAGASMNGVKVYFTTDQKWRNVDATKITREQVQQWTEATVNATTGKVTIPDGYSKPVAWAFTSPSLPANARYDFILSIKPTGNSASDAYVNRWADGDNKVDAVTQVVERKVNGVAWFDTNHDGIRQDSDRLLADVNVTLVDGNGRTVTSVNGKPCTTTTDRNGRYELTAIPAGTGFRLRFTPADGTDWSRLHVTVKNAKNASEATDSDSDQENDSHGDMVAGVITLKPFPALDEMTSAVYEDPNEDHGMSGTLMPATPATFKAVKVLDGRPNGAWTDRDRYVADITALDGAPANAVPSTITFADNRTQTLQINSNAFAKEGVYRYQVRERKGDNAGVAYDSRTWVLTVTVTDDLTTFTRRITANTTCDGVQSDAIQFTNTYAPKDATVTLTARKTFGNADNSHAKLTDFQFQLFDNEQAVGVPVQTVNAAEDGTIRFQPLTFTASQLKGSKSKTFTYTVREIRRSAGGVNYDTHMGLWQITVTDDLTGQLKAQTRTNAAYPTMFTNTYQAKPVSVQFRARKTLADPDHTGVQLQAGQYEFTCVEDKTGGQVGTVKTNDQRGDVLFDTISYTKTGVYDYTLSEVQGDRGGITYDATKHHVTVTVTDNGEGQLLADVKYDNGTNIPEFTNTYHAQPATDNPTAVKKMTSSKGNKYTLKGEDFAFTLQQQSAPANVSNADQTKRNDQQGNIRFDQLSFPLVGTYVFTMSEQDTTVPGVTKDGTVATITYVVKDVDHTGKLAVVSKTVTPTTGANGKNITFTNHYSPKNVGYSISGVKNIVNTDTATSRVPQDGEFKFQLNAVSAHDSDGNAISMDDMPMPAGSQNGTVTVTNKGSGFTFGQMVYTMPGVYTYHVKELAGTDKTIGYSTQEYDVTVTVTDQDGMLSATADSQTNDIRFDNTYTPTPVDVIVKADKHLTGRDLNDGEFTAELKDSDGNLLQTKQFTHSPRNTQSDKVTAREGDGTLDFDKLTFDRAGVYTYTVDEQDGTLGGVTYDKTIHTVTITVTEDTKSHKLVASVAYSNGKASEKSILFRNTYRPGNVMVELAARKNLTGRGLKADEFEFELVDRDGKVIDTERNDKDGDIRFKPLTYGRDNNGIDDCGEHRYVIRERNTGEKNVTYDRTEHHVTVTVGDDLQGNLTAKVEYDPTDGKTKDSSATPTDKADKTKGDAVGDQPSTTPGMVTVTGTRPEFTNSYIPPATPAIVKTIRQLAKTGVSAPTVALAAFTLLGVGLMLFRRRGNQTETARHRK
ncbi:Spy0128 family protein [Bifidobacterium breve]|uniref:Cell surface protein n=1 Tax=Bifidobacterium breve TaxID=1685 RepID=A0AAN1M2X5_BIFBR|nr:FctA domain-containing protein [Bifidobacterium breve]AUD81301.1 putative cell surface protein [Bifidobacterium breve]